ncbi:Uncharacterised protein [Amycolatopsis camponoti]|uniref:Uncharacterized protein n=1 Tax=Amycolatopsis camponoti TaxID=2606593 RepID=A0A6I8MAX8_9PSEU|nr:Uncharacterised protein [Amycolatopsis camponoti]
MPERRLVEAAKPADLTDRPAARGGRGRVTQLLQSGSISTSS